MIHVLKNETARLGSTLKRLQEKRDAADPPLPIDDEIEGIRSVSAAIIARADQLKQRYERARREPQPTDVNSLVRRVVAEIVTRPDIEVDFDDLDEHMPKLMISPGFEDVVWNIISNAQAAIPEEQEGRIKIATKVLFGKYTNQMEGFQIVFTDNGIGMSEEKQDEIGKLGFSSKEGEGSGYGMWWLDTFVERWQGKKTLHSEVGKGTEISLWFPLTPEGVAIGLEGGQV